MLALTSLDSSVNTQRPPDASHQLPDLTSQSLFPMDLNCAQHSISPQQVKLESDQRPFSTDLPDAGDEDRTKDLNVLVTVRTQTTSKKTSTQTNYRCSQQTATDKLCEPRRVSVHFKEGVVRRGIMREIDRNAETYQLEPAPNSNAEVVTLAASALKAIFVMHSCGGDCPAKTGMPCRVKMIDGRTLEGQTEDYDPRMQAFTLFPAIDRGNIERIIVFNDTIKDIYFED